MTEQQRTVLIVEDDPMIGQLLSATLRRYRVLLATCSAEAMEIARRLPNAIDAIVSDVILGREKGPVIVAQVRESSPRAMTLLISGYPLDVLYEKDILLPQSLEDGQTVFLQKPFLPKTIVQLVDKMLAATYPAALAGSGETVLNAFARY